jgi:hypothetical protein
MTQTQAILASLRRGSVLTPATALSAFGCFRLAARIHDAREFLEPDEVILSERVNVSPGVVVARYRLVHRLPAQLALAL